MSARFRMSGFSIFTAQIKLMKNSKALLVVLWGVLLALVFFAYKDHFNNPFEFDDEHTIVSNFYIRDIHNIPLFFKDARTFSSLPANQVYRPGVTTLNAVDCWWGGKGVPEPFYYHVSIFVSFILLGFLIYFFVLKIYNLSADSSLNPYIALLTTAVYMLHTANAETINYIISRSDSFSTFMILLSLSIFAYFQNLRKYLLYLIPMVIGFFVKEPTIMIAPLAFLYLYLFEQKRGLNQLFDWSKNTKLILGTIGAFIVAGAMYVLSAKMAAATFTTGGYNRWQYLLTQSFVMVHYINNYFFPFNLSADTDWGLITSPFDERFVIGVLFIAFTLYLAYRASLKVISRPITYGILWFYLAVAPTSSIFPLAEVLNDHRVFFPYIGLTVAVVWALFLAYKKYESAISKMPLAKAGIVLFISLFLAAHVYGVRERCKVWSSGETLWLDVTIKSPRNARGLMNYGNVLMSKADYKGAEDYFIRAKNLWPYYSYIYVNLGVLYNATGKPAESESNFKYALQLNNGNPNCYYFYANMLKNNGRISEARDMVTRGLAVSPNHLSLTALNNELLTNPAYATNAKSKMELLQNISKQTPTPENYLNLSLEYYRLGMYQECVDAATEALKLRPNYDLAYNNICSAYNMLKQWDNAIHSGEEGLKINPNNQLLKNNLEVSRKGKAEAN